MSVFSTHITWQPGAQEFAYKTFNRDHCWQFAGGQSIEASAAPEYLGSDKVNPEEALIASLASCHMLTFLAYCAIQKFTIVSYQDKATGQLGKLDNGKMAMIEVTLSPQVTFGGAHRPTAEQIAALHDKAHQDCFIANTVNCHITLNPTAIDDHA